MSVRSRPRHPRAAHQRTGAVATRLQPASTSRQLGRTAANLQTQSRQEQPVETPQPKPSPPGQAGPGGGAVALSDPAATVIDRRRLRTGGPLDTRFRFQPRLAPQRRGEFGALSNAALAATIRGRRTRVSQTSCGSHPIGWAVLKIGVSVVARWRRVLSALAFAASFQFIRNPGSCFRPHGPLMPPTHMRIRLSTAAGDRTPIV